MIEDNGQAADDVSRQRMSSSELKEMHFLQDAMMDGHPFDSERLNFLEWQWNQLNRPLYGSGT